MRVISAIIPAVLFIAIAVIFVVLLTHLSTVLLRMRAKKINIKVKNTIIIVIVAIMLYLGETDNFLPNHIARLSSQIYVEINYPTKNLTFRNSENATAFENYSTIYENERGDILSLSMIPQCFPVIVIYDSFKGNA